MERIAYPTSSETSDHEAVNRARTQREQSLKHRDMDAKIADEAMNEREFAYAIKVTEERLEMLKQDGGGGAGGGGAAGDGQYRRGLGVKDG